jgi:lipoyl(octanoyl) transferase
MTNINYIDWGLIDYKEAWDKQELIFNQKVSNKINNLSEKIEQDFILCEHPHVYTLGKSGSEDNLLIDHIQLQTRDAQFFRTNRGGDITYHGPGQIVGYPIFDLEEIGIGLREYISRLEEAVILTVAAFGIRASRLKEATGVWLDAEQGKRPRKICAIGVRASKYVTMHGFAFNVNTDLTYFNYINPCGFTDKGVTSLEKELGVKQDPEKIKLLVKNNLREVFDLKWIN